MQPGLKKMLDEVQWKAHPPPKDTDDGIPYITHEGVLEFCGVSLRVLQLSNGMRIFPEEELLKLFNL